MVRATILFAALPDFSSTLEFFFTGFAIFVSPSFLRLPLWATLCRKQVACQSRSRSVRRQHVNTVGFTGTTRTSTQDGDSDSTLSFSLGVGFLISQGLHAVLAAEVIDAIAIDAEKPGRFRLCLFGLGECRFDPLPLVRVDYFAELDPAGRQPQTAPSVLAGCLHDVAREIFQRDGIAIRHQNH